MALRYGPCWETVWAASGSERAAADWSGLRPAGSLRLTSRKDCPAIRSPRWQRTKAADYGWEPRLAWRYIRTDTWPRLAPSRNFMANRSRCYTGIGREMCGWAPPARAS